MERHLVVLFFLFCLSQKDLHHAHRVVRRSPFASTRELRRRSSRVEAVGSLVDPSDRGLQRMIVGEELEVLPTGGIIQPSSDSDQQKNLPDDKRSSLQPSWTSSAKTSAPDPRGANAENNERTHSWLQEQTAGGTTSGHAEALFAGNTAIKSTSSGRYKVGRTPWEPVKYTSDSDQQTNLPDEGDQRSSLLVLDKWEPGKYTASGSKESSPPTASTRELRRRSARVEAVGELVDPSDRGLLEEVLPTRAQTIVGELEVLPTGEIVLQQPSSGSDQQKNLPDKRSSLLVLDKWEPGTYTSSGSRDDLTTIVEDDKRSSLLLVLDNNRWEPGTYTASGSKDDLTTIDHNAPTVLPRSEEKNQEIRDLGSGYAVTE